MNIGLIAHNSKKKLMQNFCIAYKGILNKNQLFATGTTGRLVEEVTNLSIHKFLAGHLGGDQQLCAQIEHNQLDLVIFLRDVESPNLHEPDSNNICMLCDMYNIPLATNLATVLLPEPAGPSIAIDGFFSFIFISSIAIFCLLNLV